MCNSVNLVLTKKPLNNMPTVIVLQDRIGRFSGLLRPTGDSICGRGQIFGTYCNISRKCNWKRSERYI
ncbi:hypothetical protein QL093DRAFT_2460481 [Fusarium oxysporum]|nr:hypothetical protein QL093DRAFT_2460481 [Fusarium oxysporum]